MNQISTEHPVAYFCAEYGLQADLPLYAGGLGVLAGDTVKAAADINFPMVAIGLLYRKNKAIQHIDEHGWQTEEDLLIEPEKSGFEQVNSPDDQSQPLFIKVNLMKQVVWARVWKRSINQVIVYLLDTDTDQNTSDDRDVTHALYYGSEDDLIKQQMVLGIGGVKILDKLNIRPSIYHINEGRPALCYWQLIRRLMDQDKLTYEQAASKARSLIVYTNHTLVRAGNLVYDPSLLEYYALYYANKMGVTAQELLKPGIDEQTGKFQMTKFALNTSRKASAVSRMHYELSQTIWPEYSWVGITNGVHLATWQDADIRNCDMFGNDLWQVHMKKKSNLAHFVKERTGYIYNPNSLILGWARRIAGYKRPNALFEDISRLKRIVQNTNRPVHILFSGKAHAKNTAAKKLIQDIIHRMQHELSGHILFIPNYDIDIAQMLVKGVDVWLNTPLLGHEACGTSGMKAIANGVLQLTVKDGWAAEHNWDDTGWILDGTNVSESLYTLLEKVIVPTFYNRDEFGVPQAWIERMKKSIELAEQYSAKRMLQEYRDLLYR